tara:strand:+ start:49 stop:732 length:684 start_codon:yes stop_codon:yes gene_type:complete
MQKERYNSDFVIYYTSPDYLSGAARCYEAMYETDRIFHEKRINELTELIKKDGFLIDPPRDDGFQKPDPWFGSRRPNVPMVTLDSQGYLVLMDGNHRTLAAKRAGIEKMPFIFNEILCDNDEFRKNSMFYASKKGVSKYLINKYPDLNLHEDEGFLEIINSAAYGLCSSPTKVTTKEFIEKHTYVNKNIWDGVFLDSPDNISFSEGKDFRKDCLPKDFLEKTNFQFA